jgi:hypothetical protein
MKADGSCSLDAARAEHAHHGLTLKVQTIKETPGLVESASALRAVPMVSQAGDRRGTFELWHDIAREGPLVGNAKREFSGGYTNGPEVLMIGDDKRLGYIDVRGLSLFDCLVGAPSMYEWLGSIGCRSEVIRASCSHDIRQNERTLNIIIHPHQSIEVIESLQSRFLFEASAVNRLSIVEFPNWFNLKWTESSSDSVRAFLPQATSWNASEVRFHNAIPLNEFGLFYVGLFMLGNYARYFPDAWVRDVEARSPLALACEEFLAQAERRMALLCLSELSSSCYVPLD